MPISVACPSCQARYSLPDAMRGKRAKCKKCQTGFAIDEALSEPAAPQRKAVTLPATSTPPPPARSSKGLVLAMLAALVVILGGLAVSFLALGNKSEPTPQGDLAAVKDLGKDAGLPDLTKALDKIDPGKVVDPSKIADLTKDLPSIDPSKLPDLPKSPESEPKKDAKPKFVMSGHPSVINGLVTVDGKTLYSSSMVNIQAKEREPTVRRWDLASGMELAPMPITSDVRQIAVTPDGKTMIVIANESVTSVRTEVWDLVTLTKRADIKEEGHSSFRIALSPDGKVLATATLAGQIRLYDLATGKARAVFGLKQTVFALAFAPDGATVVAAGGAGTGGGVVALCDVAAGKERATFKASEQLLSAVAIAPDGAVLATGGNDAVVRFWDLATLKEVGALKGPKRNITALAFSPSGRLLACGAHTIHIYDVPFGAERAALPGASSVIDEVMLFLPDGSLLTSGGREIKLWAAPKPLVP